MKRSGAFFLFPQPFIDRNCHRIGKIQTAVEFSGHGDNAQSVGVTLVKFRGKSCGFSAENQIISGGVFHIVITGISVSGEKVQVRFRIEFQKIFPIGVTVEIKMFPVIHSRPAQMFFIKRKAQRVNKMKNAVR